MKEFEINYKCQYKDYKDEPWPMPVDTSWLEQSHEKPEMIDPKKMITRAKEITIHFDYPLSEETDITFWSKNGFTRKKFYDCIVKGYKRIYAKEETYGIWGHDIGDLIVEKVYKQGKKYYLYIGS